jgi:hypothetical protein
MHFRPGRRTGLGERGQTLVEFALVFPLFLSVFIAVIEFAFLSNALLAVSFAARDASATAAEACGDGTCGMWSEYPSADCHILATIERDITAPADPSLVESVSIYWTDINGHIAGSGAAVTRYERGGSTECNADGDTVPYTLVQDGYPQDQRCSILSGCPHIEAIDEDAHDGLDVIGVSITYDYHWRTPYSTIFGAFSGNDAGVTLSRGAEMRMEPTL